MKSGWLPDSGSIFIVIEVSRGHSTEGKNPRELVPIYEPLFSDDSYGYRPNRSAQQAIQKVKWYAEQGYTSAVLVDLSKYFDTLNHELLMNLLRKNIHDKRVIKEFLSPVYPAMDGVFTEKKRQDRIALCQKFVEGKISLYTALREASDGHLITVEQFFRAGAKYYISTEAIQDPILSVEAISACSFVDQLRLCCSVAHSMARVHEKKIVHSDIKQDNILVVRKGSLRANIIDFDCSFFEHNCPKLGEELNGDLVYLAPEGFLHIAGIESNLSCKLDVFALGLLFCQYFTGKLPEFDTSEYQYAYESVLDDHPLGVGDVVNEECRSLLGTMLSKNPADRPDMKTVFRTLNKILLYMLGRSAPENPVSENATPDEVEPDRDVVTHPAPAPGTETNPEAGVESGAGNFFFVAGDL